jgi:cytosine/adenosine deaminase-related metal-dependent hydrolase
MSSTLFKNVRVLTMDERDRELASTDVLVSDGVIAEMGLGLPLTPETRVVAGQGTLLMPGLINGHFHSPGNFNKGSLDDMPLELFMLYEVPPFDCPPVSPRLNYIRTLLGAAEMLKTGVTAVHDDPFYVPDVSMDLIDAAMQAYADSGIRATVSINMPNVIEYEKYPYLRDLLPEAFREKMRTSQPLSTNELLALYRQFIARWHNRNGGLLRTSVSCSAPQRVKVDYLQGLSELSAQFDLPYNMHILETRLQRVLGDRLYGKSLVKYVHQHEVLTDRAMVIHAIWVDAEDMDLLAASGCSVGHNPLCNLKLGSGIMPFRELTNRGINICLGSDEMCSDDAVNLWNVSKFAGLVHKIAEPDYRKWPTAHEILRCATVNAARAMRIDDVGSIERGKQADLILVDLGTLAFTPLNDLRRQLVFCENGSSVRMVMVSGRIVMEDGRLLTIDEEQLKAESRELMAEYRSQYRAVDHWARELEPIYRSMYERCLQEPVPVRRTVGM